MIASRRFPLIIGHRGASTLAPENTLAAFARAFEDGADGIELDVRLARDGVPVVIHDADLRRTAGLNTLVAGLTSTQLHEIDVGSWFNNTHPDLATIDYVNQTIPTLDEVFTLMRNSSRRDTIVYVEMKTVRDRELNRRLAAAVVELVYRHDFVKRAVVISFNLTAVAAVKRIDPAIRTGALFGPRQRAGKSARRIISATAGCGASHICLHHLVARPKLLQLARGEKLTTVVWTVDDPRWLQRARDTGIHAIMTNNPARVR